MSKQYSSKDLELPDDEPMVIIRSSFLWICDGDKYAAAALNMYVHWTRWLMKHRPVARQVNRLLRQQGKTPNQDTSLILYRKQSALVKDLLHFCSEKRLRQANDLLISKGLLKVDDTPRSISDHVLKYELQIDKLQELMQQWKDQRKGNTEDEFDDEEVEINLEADSDGTDNLPLRDDKSSASSSSRNGKFTDRSGKKAVSNNRYNQRDDTFIDNEERDSDVNQEPTNITTSTGSPSSQEMNKKVELFRTTFITLGREYFAYNKFTANRVQPGSELYTSILEIIGNGEVSPQAMRTAFLKLWNHKDRDGTYWWQDKSKLTLKAYINNYDDQDTKHATSSSTSITPTTSDIHRSTRRTRKRQEGFITEGPLAGQPDYDADPWS